MTTQTAQRTMTTLTPSAARGVLQVVVHGVRDHGGYLRVSLHDKSTGFPLQGKSRETRFVRAVNGTTTLRFVGVPTDGLAVAVFDQVDKKKKDDDSSLIDMMSRGYAFSNDIDSDGAAPSFDDARFDLNGLAATIELTMKTL